MGGIAKKIFRRFAKNAGSLSTNEPKRRRGELLPGGIQDIETLVKSGLDPRIGKTLVLSDGAL